MNRLRRDYERAAARPTKHARTPWPILIKSSASPADNECSGGRSDDRSHALICRRQRPADVKSSKNQVALASPRRMVRWPRRPRMAAYTRSDVGGGGGSQAREFARNTGRRFQQRSAVSQQRSARRACKRGPRLRALMSDADTMHRSAADPTSACEQPSALSLQRFAKGSGASRLCISDAS